MKAPHTLCLASTMPWDPGVEGVPLPFLLLGVVDGHAVTDSDEQEGRQAQHAGEDGEWHVHHHPDQLGSAPAPSAHELKAGARLALFNGRTVFPRRYMPVGDLLIPSLSHTVSGLSPSQANPFYVPLSLVRLKDRRY